MAENRPVVRISVVYASPGRQFLRELALPAGADVAAALEASGVFRDFPEIDRKAADVGIFGAVVERATVLEDGDRVEIYRKLALNPKEARRRRAKGG